MWIDEDVLRLDISMSDGKGSYIVESFECLIDVDFDEGDGQLFFFNHLIQIVGKVIHNDI